jgi:serine/threonine-protein kinase
MGKLAYMSPEQLRGEPVTRAVDLFAVAVVVTELILGTRYYGSKSAHETWTIAASGNAPARSGSFSSEGSAEARRLLQVRVLAP